jgi:hypothetical protein
MVPLLHFIWKRGWHRPHSLADVKLVLGTYLKTKQFMRASHQLRQTIQKRIRSGRGRVAVPKPQPSTTTEGAVQNTHLPWNTYEGVQRLFVMAKGARTDTQSETERDPLCTLGWAHSAWLGCCRYT